MLKTLMLPTLLLAALSWPSHQSSSAASTFHKAAMTIEYDATADEATILIQAENDDPVSNLRIEGPEGTSILEVRSESGKPIGIASFHLELQGSAPESVFANYSEGVYKMRGRGPGGGLVSGDASLSHRMVRPAVVTYPTDGALVSTSGLVVTWLPVPDAAGYRVAVERGDDEDDDGEEDDDDGDEVVVTLPPWATTYNVPDGFLRPGEDAQVEVGVLAPNGNCTTVEVEFQTR